MNRRANTKIYDWTLRYYYSLLVLFTPVASLILGFSFGFQVVTQSIPFLIYFFLIVFTLPSLISKSILGENSFSLAAVYSFLIYPAIYFVGLVLRSIGIDLAGYYEFAGSGLIAIWTLLALRLIFKAKFNGFRASYKRILLALLPFIVFIGVIVIARDYGSIISTDILVHKTVLNGMSDPQTVGFMPASYSSTFTDQAYPIVMFHAFLYTLANAFKFDYALAGYFVDIFLTLIFSIAAYKLFRKYYKPGWAVLGVTLSLLVFENLAYTAHFFIPQTFAFLLFLFILGDKDLKFRGLIAAIGILLLTHFFIGIFLSFFLIVKYIYYERVIKVESKKQNLLLFQEIILVFLFIISLSITGFSIENSFQKGITDWVGGLSNPDFRGKFDAILALIGAGWLVLIPAFLRVFFKPHKTMPELIGYFGMMTTIAIYFLAPTFAGKFLLGFGLFSSLVVIAFLQKLKPKHLLVYVVIGILLITSYGVNYVLQLQTLTSFILQNNGPTSAVVKKDNNLVKYWQENSPKCVLISDPQTQLTIHSLGEGESLRGNYMNLGDRNTFVEFIGSPNADTLEKVKNLTDLSDPRYAGKPLCIGITARLMELATKDHRWTKMIFTYQVDHTDRLNKQVEVIRFLDKNANEIYNDDYHAVFLLSLNKDSNE